MSKKNLNIHINDEIKKFSVSTTTANLKQQVQLYSKRWCSKISGLSHVKAEKWLNSWEKTFLEWLNLEKEHVVQ